MIRPHLPVLPALFLAWSLLACGPPPEQPRLPVGLELLPSSAVLRGAETIRFRAVLLFSDGSQEAAAEATFGSSDDRLLTVDESGIVTLAAGAMGLGSVQARMEEWTAAAPVAVLREGADQVLGPLRVNPAHPFFFETPEGRSVYLTGSHTWSDFQDSGRTDPPPTFDYAKWLAFLVAHGHTAFRMWSWEQATWTAEIQGPWHFRPVPWIRTGPGMALDGKPRFDLERFNETYFLRLRERVKAARDLGLYVIVMLFNGWSVESRGPGRNNPWPGHPFHRSNNVNGVDGDPWGTGEGTRLHSLADTAVTRIQDEYVRRVVESVGDLENVLFEVSNESNSLSLSWQAHIVALVRSLEAGKALQHPVGITAPLPTSNDLLKSGPADWISPKGSLEDTPSGGGKIVVNDTDHLCGVCGSRDWAWRTMTAGANPLLMDGYDKAALGLGAIEYDPTEPRWADTRRNLGYTATVAALLPLSEMVPQPELSTLGHVLAAKGGNPPYLVYLSKPERAILEIKGIPPLPVTCLDPVTGVTVGIPPVSGPGPVAIECPFPNDAVAVVGVGRPSTGIP